MFGGGNKNIAEGDRRRSGKLRDKGGYKSPAAGVATANVKQQEKRRKRRGRVNRKQARAAMRGKAKAPNLNDPRQAQAMLENLPIATLVAGVNNSLDILQKRGVPISDWDQKKRELYRLKVFGGKVYFLAAELDRSEQKNE